jgi:hypothetical protein
MMKLKFFLAGSKGGGAGESFNNLIPAPVVWLDGLVLDGLVLDGLVLDGLVLDGLVLDNCGGDVTLDDCCCDGLV